MALVLTHATHATHATDADTIDDDTLVVTILGSIIISDVQVYLIHQNDYVYITTDPITRIPIGLIVYVSGYNEPFIYFDELEGPRVFPHFCENMFHQCLNWVNTNVGFNDDADYLELLFELAKNEAHRNLNRIIIEAQDRLNEEDQFQMDA